MTREQAREQILRGNYYERVIKPAAGQANAAERHRHLKSVQMGTHRRPGSYHFPGCEKAALTSADFDDVTR